MNTFVMNWKPATPNELDMVDQQHRFFYGTSFGHASIKSGRVAERAVAKKIFDKKIKFVSSALEPYYKELGILDKIDLLNCDLFSQNLAEIALEEGLSVDKAFDVLTLSNTLRKYITQQSMKEIVDKVSYLVTVDI